jgi:hypothetical protein
MDDMDRRIRALVAEGFSDRQIAREVGLSRTAVRKRRAKFPADPWTDETDDGDELDELDDLDALNADERWPVEPLVFCGRERQWFSRGAGNGGYWADCERWLDANGDSVGDEHESAEMALYRYRCHVAYELDDHERADALSDDWQRQRDEYERHLPQPSADRPQQI